MDIFRGKNSMVKCTKCSTDVAKPKKTWKMAGRPDKAGKRTQLEIGLYECPKCKNTFREVLSKCKI
jgi:ribosomal protein L37AE/L43A